MSYTFDATIPLEGTTRFDNGDFYAAIRNNLDSIDKKFAGTTFPTDPITGQFCIRTDRGADAGVLYVYSGNPNIGENGWKDWSAYSSYYNNPNFVDKAISGSNNNLSIRDTSRIRVTAASAASIDNFVDQNEGQKLILLITASNVTINNSVAAISASTPGIQLLNQTNYTPASDARLVLRNVKTSNDMPTWVEISRSEG